MEILIGRGEENKYCVILVSDIINQCHVGFLKRDKVEHSEYDVTLVQATEVY